MKDENSYQNQFFWINVCGAQSGEENKISLLSLHFQLQTHCGLFFSLPERATAFLLVSFCVTRLGFLPAWYRQVVSFFWLPLGVTLDLWNIVSFAPSLGICQTPTGCYSMLPEIFKSRTMYSCSIIYDSRIMEAARVCWQMNWLKK